MTTQHTFYSLNMPDWTVTGVTDRRVVIGKKTTILARVVDAEYVGLLECSDRNGSGRGCGFIGLRDEFKHPELRPTRFIQDQPDGMLPVQIAISQLRVRCTKCGNRFLQQLPDVDDTMWMTRRLKSYVEDMYFCPFMTATSLANRVGIDESTVQDIGANIISRRLKGRRTTAPEYLGIDEKWIGKALRPVFTKLPEPGSSETTELLMITEISSKEAVVEALRSLPNPENIRCVAMDGSNMLRAAVIEAFGPKPIVLDSFHFHKPLHLLHLKQPFLSRKKQLVEMIKSAPDRATGEASIDEWIAGLDAGERTVFRRFLTMYAGWRDEVLRYFEKRITNAGTEAKNGLIQTLIRIGRGSSVRTIMGKAVFHNRFLYNETWLSCRACGAICHDATIMRLVGSKYAALGRTAVSDRGYVHLEHNGAQVPIQLLWECDQCHVEDPAFSLDHTPLESGIEGAEGNGYLMPKGPHQTEEEWREAYMRWESWCASTPEWRTLAQQACLPPEVAKAA